MYLGLDLGSEVVVVVVVGGNVGVEGYIYRARFHHNVTAKIFRL